jgi:multiple sugar transport system substrate-binding protein
MASAKGSLALAMLLTASAAWPALAADKPLAGVKINVAAQNDQWSGPLVKLAPEFEAATGIEVHVDVLSYPELLTKITADFVGNTQGYDVVTMDNVWSGQFAESGDTVVLNDWIERDKAEIRPDDIYPVLMSSLGNYEGKQVAFPFAGYANVLAYRSDLYAAAGLQPPATMGQLMADARQLTNKSEKQYGWVANGQKGPAVAQDWMQYNAQLGGSIMGKDGKPALNSDANVQSVKLYKELFDQTAPPGAVEFDWGGREESFRQGIVANMQTWSVGAAAYSDPSQSKVVGKNKIAVAPVAEGMQPTYGVGGWGMAINADVDDEHKEAAWTYIKWVTSASVQKELAKMYGGGFLRRSNVKDPDLVAMFPFLPVIDESFEHGNGDFRPRIPQYPEIQDLLGTAVNAVLAGGADAKAALDEAQAKALTLF